MLGGGSSPVSLHNPEGTLSFALSQVASRPSVPWMHHGRPPRNALYAGAGSFWPAACLVPPLGSQALCGFGPLVAPRSLAGITHQPLGVCSSWTKHQSHLCSGPGQGWELRCLEARLCPLKWRKQST